MNAKRTPPPSDTADKFMLRLPEGMRDRIAEEAKKNNRSMNGEIVERLNRTLSMDMRDIDQFILSTIEIEEIISRSIERFRHSESIPPPKSEDDYNR